MIHTECLGPIEEGKHLLSSPFLEKGARLLQQGAVVAFPTETVYGLGASIFNTMAIKRLYDVKKRSYTQPLPLLLANLRQLPFVVAAIPKQFMLLFRKFLPGPLTVILPKHPRISSLISAGKDSIAIRFSSNPIANRLIELTGCPLAVSSANLSGKISATEAMHVWEDFTGQIHAIVDGGRAKHGRESTILSLEHAQKPRLFRQGVITKEEIEETLELPVEVVPKEKESAVFRFSKSRSCIRLFSSWEEMTVYLQLSKKSKRLIMARNPAPRSLSTFDYFPLTVANFYAGLRLADQQQYKEILILRHTELQKITSLLE